MHMIQMRRFVATIATAALIGAFASHWLAAASPATRVAGYCGGTGCINQTWLWLPAMRRAR